MCGIAGIVSKNLKAKEKIVRQMTDSIAHRGPDGEGVFLDDEAVLGHRRLSILDLSSSGSQPMLSDDGRYTIIFNGEIYNYLELKKELHGEKFNGSSDTEVLLKCYQKWGEGFLNKLNGIFAFAVWDKKTKTLFCARDHLGVKPFYYYFKNGNFYFASEIKAILKAGIMTKPNNKAIYDYLVWGFYQHLNESFFEGIFELPAGASLTLKNGQMKISRYWKLSDSFLDMEGWSEKKVENEFLKIFFDAVRIQLRSDVPVGIQLSGGLDSSAVTAMVDKVNKGQKKFRIFSFIYEAEKEKELPYMKSLAKALGWKQDFLKISPNHMKKTMEDVVYHQEIPFPGLPTFGQHEIAKECGKHGIKVILGGQGGDEIGTGYEYYMGAHLLDLINNSGAGGALRELTKYGALRGINEPAALLNFFVNSLGSYLNFGTSADGTSFVFPQGLRKEFFGLKFSRPEFESPFLSRLSNMQYRDIVYTKLPRILHAADRSAMHFGVEHRVPFLDKRLVEFGVSLPSKFKIKDGQQRHFMRAALSKILPAKVKDAPKRAIPSPQREWFKTELRPWILSVLSSKSFGQRPYFDQKKILAEYEKYCKTPGVPKNSFHIWQWIHLETWLRVFFD